MFNFHPEDNRHIEDWEIFDDCRSNFIRECEDDENLLYYDNETDYDIFDYE